MAGGDIRSLSREFLVEFIELYKSQTCLWEFKSYDYTNKNKKKLAYEKLVKKLREVEPNANKASVVKKINSLRTCFRKTHRKVLRSKKSGKADQSYQPSLWYYNLLLFITEADKQKQALSSSNRPETKIEYNDTSEEQNTELDAVDETVTYNSASELELDRYPSPSPRRRSPRASRKPSNLIRKRKAEKVLDMVTEKLQKANEQQYEFENFGRHVAEQLRKVSKNQAIYLTKIINDGIFEAQCEFLTRNSRIVSAPDVQTTDPLSFMSITTEENNHVHTNN